MSARRDDEHEAGALLRAASAEYDDLPRDVADRLDRVLEQLPSADTLHAGERRTSPAWIEWLRARRVRYALVSATAALIVTVGAVAAAVQVVSTSTGGDGGAGVSAEQEPDGAFDEGASEDAAATPEGDDFAAEEEETQAESPQGDDETSSVETFATGTDYTAQSDLLTALQELNGDSPDAAVPPQLTALADGGTMWERCQEALAERYGSLIVAVDFARFESQPAVLALLASESSETAVAVTPACADGVIEELFVQG